MDPGAMERETIDGVVNVMVELGILRNSFVVCIAKDCGTVHVRGQREALLGAFNIFASATAFVGDFLQAQESMVDSSYTGSCRHSLDYILILTWRSHILANEILNL